MLVAGVVGGSHVEADPVHMQAAHVRKTMCEPGTIGPERPDMKLVRNAKRDGVSLEFGDLCVAKK